MCQAAVDIETILVQAEEQVKKIDFTVLAQGEDIYVREILLPDGYYIEGLSIHPSGSA